MRRRADELREELKSFLRELAIPAIFVTHDRSDAMTLADKIVVLRDGAVMQSGLAAEVFQKPVNSFVARFVGVENILPGRVNEVSETFVTLAVGEGTLRAAAPAEPVTPGSLLFLCIRGEDVGFHCLCGTQSPRGGINRLEGRVASLHSGGPLVTVSIDCGFLLKAYVLARQAREMKLGSGSVVAVEIAAEAIHVMGE